MTKRNATWWNPLTWMASKAAPPAPISIDERKILAYVGGQIANHGVRLWNLDGGFCVTIVPHGNPRDASFREARVRDIAREQKRRERGGQ